MANPVMSNTLAIVVTLRSRLDSVATPRQPEERCFPISMSRLVQRPDQILSDKMAWFCLQVGNGMQLSYKASEPANQKTEELSYTPGEKFPRTLAQAGFRAELHPASY
jgi:hypothetical protein